MQRAVVLAAALFTTAAGPALAQPYGGARLLPVRSEAQARHGYQLAKPDMVATAAGVRAHGTICRRAGHVGAPVRMIQLQHLDPTGRVLAAVRVRVAGWEIGNVDSTIIAQAPKLAPHIPAMCARIAEALGVAPGQVNVKAKTAEKMGPVGEGRAMEARAAVLLYSRGNAPAALA